MPNLGSISALPRSERARITSLVEGVVVDMSLRSYLWFQEEWAAVPVTNFMYTESQHGQWLDRCEAEWLAAAAMAHGCSECMAIPLGEHPDRGLYRVPMDQDSLLEVSKLCERQEYVLIPESKTFVVLCLFDYNVVAGPRSFVIQAIGCSIPTARKEFSEAALEDSVSQEEKPRLARLADAMRTYMYYDGMAIQRVDNPDDVDRALSLMNDIIESGVYIRGDWIGKHGWIAVPVVKDSHVSVRQAEWLISAARLAGEDSVFAVATGDNESLPVYRVGMNHEELEGFSKECSIYTYLLVPETMSFAMLCTIEDYNIIAGPAEFVRSALGCSISTARASFRDFVEIPGWSETVRQFYAGVADRYE